MITQGTSVKAFEEPTFLDEELNLKPWLVRGARNLTLIMRRSLMRKLRSLRQVAELLPQAGPENVEEQIVQAEDQQELKAVHENLVSDEHEQITLRYATAVPRLRLSREFQPGAFRCGIRDDSALRDPARAVLNST